MRQSNPIQSNANAAMVQLGVEEVEGGPSKNRCGAARWSSHTSETK
jgi:hypothetical protein